MKVHLFTVGRIKNSVFEPAFQEYLKRMRWPIETKEIPVSNPAEEARQLLGYAPPQAMHVCLDERGDMVDSPAFSSKIQHVQNQGIKHLVFWIGGPEGLDKTLIKPKWCIALGRMTWPHMLARVMIMEQLYRAQQILDGHPYHKS